MKMNVTAQNHQSIFLGPTTTFIFTAPNLIYLLASIFSAKIATFVAISQVTEIVCFQMEISEF